MAQYALSIRYIGESLEDGRMPIADLAPSLLALSGALQEIQKIKNPNSDRISVDIKATQKGSFIVDLVLANGQDIFSRAIDLLSGKDTTAAANLIAIISVLGVVIKLIKSKSKKEEKNEEGQTTITLDSGEKIILSADDIKVYRNIEVRTHIKSIVAPLSNKGVDSLEIISEKSEKITIEKNDITQFEVPEIKEEILEPIRTEVYLQLLNVAFEHGKWKFSDGANQFFASIEDKAFMADVELGNQKFSTSDRLFVRLRTEQKVSGTGLKAEFIIEEVLDHIAGPQQLELDFG